MNQVFESSFGRNLRDILWCSNYHNKSVEKTAQVKNLYEGVYIFLRLNIEFSSIKYLF